MYCQYCGKELAPRAVTCPNCGAPVRRVVYCYEDSSPKSRLVAALLCFFLGHIGVHRFYAGRILSGIFMLFTFGLLGIWTIIDLVVILCGEFKDSQGMKIRNWLDY